MCQRRPLSRETVFNRWACASRYGLVWLAAIAWLVLSADNALAKRVALVIGNSAYTNVATLKNPANDARLISDKLGEAGFEVTTVIDADLRSMKRAMIQFGRDIRAQTEASVFYYAGHGVQVRGENYLLPVTANISAQDEIDLEAININLFLRLMESSQSGVNIVILDSCRNNPFASLSRSVSRGLAPVLAPRGTYIAYSTAPGDIALDGEGQNSHYTKALAETITTPGLEIARVFRDVRRKVVEATGERQVPWESSSIIGEFYFMPPQPAPAPEVSSGDNQPGVADPYVKAAREWQALEASGDRAALRAFVEQYKGNPFASLAAARLKELGPGSVDTQPQVKASASQSQVPQPRKEEMKVAALPKETIASRLLEDMPDESEPSEPSTEPAERAYKIAKRIDTPRSWQLFYRKYGAHRKYGPLALATIKTGDQARSIATDEEAVEAILALDRTQRLNVQKRLAARGHPVGALDGIIGPNTRRAIARYQRDLGIKQTGFLSLSFLRRLGASPSPDGGEDFVSSQKAKIISSNDLEALGEDKKIVDAIRCLGLNYVIYGRYQNKLYIAVIRGMNGGYIKMLAEKCGGYLVAINSRAESRFVYDLVANEDRFFTYQYFDGQSFKHGPMIGLVQDPKAKEPRGGWRWANGDKITYSNWSPGNPDDFRSRQDYSSFFLVVRGKKDLRKARADRWDDTSGTGSGFIMELD
ncbi:hypothetical protein GR183_19550 [Stappia sp. GBMRC 2046]|uniref:Caspase family p20 domain-containing protein n=1 Tax=Stappia sediminis TaxID=2692190 RepID=A0A7X3S9T0_9HYPH|nr:caspase family protein [Stappia sediminis]MXN67110.1 hypothetical protein [Stappia sediminis]